MLTKYISAFLAVGLAQQSLAQLAKTTTKDSTGKAIYAPSAGSSTSSVATPSATPTLVYNCAHMPLICENVAAWAIANGQTSGDVPTNQIFYFDPDEDNKKNRRRGACGCFEHDKCVGEGKSEGKRKGEKVTNIASSTVAVNPIDPANTQTLLAGPNPRPNEPRVPSNGIPGRFYGQGVAFSCDEFPAATFIEGGDGSQNICAMQSWQIFSGKPGIDKKGKPKNLGKWPLPPKHGVRQEQDFQGSSHGLLRVSLVYNVATFIY